MKEDWKDGRRGEEKTQGRGNCKGAKAQGGKEMESKRAKKIRKEGVYVQY